MMRQGFKSVDWEFISEQSKSEFVVNAGFLLKDVFYNCSNKLDISLIIYHCSVIYLIKHYASHPIQAYFLPRLVSGDTINLYIDKNINEFIHNQSTDLALVNRNNKANIFVNKIGNQFSFVLRDIEYPFDLNHPECLPSKITIISKENAKTALCELFELHRYFFGVATDAHLAAASIMAEEELVVIRKCLDLDILRLKDGKYPTKMSENDQY